LEQLEHVFGGKVADFFDGFAFQLFGDHRRRGLANTTTIAIEVGFLDLPIVNSQFDTHEITAQRVVIFVSMGRPNARTPMVRVFVVIQDMLLVQFVF